MKKLFIPICALSLLFGACQKEQSLLNRHFASSSASSSSAGEQVVQGEYIVQLSKGFFNDAIAQFSTYPSKVLAAKQAVKLFLNGLPNASEIQVHNVFVAALDGFSATLTEAQANVLIELPGVIGVEKNKVGRLIGDVKTSKVKSDISAAAGEAQYGVLRTGFGDGTGKKAFIIDSGIDLDHEDLNVNTELSIDFTNDGGGLFGGGSGFFGGGIFGGGEPAPEGDDDNGHGTHCAGIVAAKDNGIGVVGVAANAEVVAVKCFNFLGNGNADDVLQGIDYVAFEGEAGDAVNMSFGFALGGSATVDAATQELGELGLFVAVAAGNDGVDASNTSPARANGVNLYTVSAMDNQDNFASFSNFGNPPVDFCAPGVDIYSTYTNNGYSTLSGTSMATPHVVGLLLMTNGSLNTDGFVNNDPDGNADPIAHL